jgi:hypothetical protein
VDGDRLRRARNDVTEVARSGPDWVSFAIEVTDTVQKAIPFDRCHWHTVGPGTVLFTGSANRDVSCSLSTSTPSRTWTSRAALASDPRSPMDRRRAARVVRRRRHLLGRRHLPARQRPVLVHRRRRAVLIFPAAEHWIAQLVEEPPPGTPS